MKILVFGGTGFIGTALQKALVARGHQVKTSDIRRDPAWKIEIGVADVVVNLAGAPIFGKRWSDDVKDEIHRSRVEGTRKIVDAMGAAKKKGSKLSALVNASAIGFYGPTFDEELSESSPAGSDFLAFVCREWEESAQKAERVYGIRTVCVRTGIVLADGGGALAKMLPAFKAFVGGPIGAGKQWMSWVHLDDVVGVYVHAIENAQISGPLNATAPHPRRNKDFSKALGKALGRPSFLPVPGLALYAVFGEVAEILVNGQKALPRATQESGYVFRYPELEPALKNILS